MIDDVQDDAQKAEAEVTRLTTRITELEAQVVDLVRELDRVDELLLAMKTERDLMAELDAHVGKELVWEDREDMTDEQARIAVIVRLMVRLRRGHQQMEAAVADRGERIAALEAEVMDAHWLLKGLAP